MDKKVILMILDGWGIAKNPEVSAIDKARTPFVDSLYRKYSHGKLEASGFAVGLPDGQMGNSEVGHMNLGAGRVVYQNLVKVNMAVENKSLWDNEVLSQIFNYATKYKKKVHLLGLLSDGGVHSHIGHLKALTQICADKKVNNVFIHAFTDGRDVDPKSSISYIKDLQSHLDETTGSIATIVGRYYAMDRDNRWERIKRAYDLLVNGIGQKTEDIFKSIEESYQNGITDEFIEPIVAKQSTIQEGDAVICFNYRTDRGRQITQALCQRDFPEYQMRKLKLHYTTMTNYDKTFENINVIFDTENLTNTLGEVLCKNNKKQIRIAETEKYPHVTFFFSGGKEQEFSNEKRLLCPSPKVATYDLQPQMSAYQIKDTIIPELEKKEVDFVCLNFANPDMVGHTGVMKAAIKACETVDKCTLEVTDAALKNGYTVLVIADHGNSDCMQNGDGSPNTAHTTQPVPCILVDKDYRKPIKDGKLGDIAPTILELMGLPQPEEMTGTSIL